jgi:TonB family protein
VPYPENPSGGALPPGDPDVHLQRLIAPQDLDLPWHRSLYRNLRELIHPPRLPPLELTSKPVVVKDIWGLYGRQKKSFVMSAGFQAMLVAGIALVGLSNSPVPREVRNMVRHIYLETMPADVPPMPPSAKSGGGNGGDGSVLPPSRGNLAPATKRQWEPPVQVYNNLDPKLSMNPSIVLADAVYPDPNSKTFGDPFAPNGPLSNGPGYRGGIGNGCCGGQGSGNGNGGGPGSGGTGFTDGVFVAGRTGLINPVVLYKPEPDYSDDARKAKLQGTVLLEVVVDQDGRPQIRKVLQSLGLGLDEQAIKAVSLWRFKAGTKDGKPVPVLVNVVVGFRLL